MMVPDGAKGSTVASPTSGPDPTSSDPTVTTFFNRDDVVRTRHAAEPVVRP